MGSIDRLIRRAVTAALSVPLIRRAMGWAFCTESGACMSMTLCFYVTYLLAPSPVRWKSLMGAVALGFGATMFKRWLFAGTAIHIQSDEPDDDEGEEEEAETAAPSRAPTRDEARFS